MALKLFKTHKYEIVESFDEDKTNKKIKILFNFSLC